MRGAHPVLRCSDDACGRRVVSTKMRGTRMSTPDVNRAWCACTGVLLLALISGGVLSARQNGSANPVGTVPPAGTVPDFGRDITPILERHCYECHGPTKAKGSLRLDIRDRAFRGGTTGPAILPGNSEQSLLVRRLLGLDGEDRMPLDKDPLPEPQIATLRRWIDGGAPWPQSPGAPASSAADATDARTHWAYVRPVRPALPAVRHESLDPHADRSLRGRAPREGRPRALTRSRRAKRCSAASRLDLTGLPPTPGGSRRLPGRPRADAYERRSTACSPRRTTASAGRVRGSTWRATPTPTATRRTASARSGATATG